MSLLRPLGIATALAFVILGLLLLVDDEDSDGLGGFRTWLQGSPQLLGMALRGQLKIAVETGFGSGGYHLTAMPLTLTAMLLYLLGRESRTAERRAPSGPGWQPIALLSITTGFLGALLVAFVCWLAKVDAGDAIKTMIGVSFGWTLLYGTVLLGLAIAVGRILGRLRSESSPTPEPWLAAPLRLLAPWRSPARLIRDQVLIGCVLGLLVVVVWSLDDIESFRDTVAAVLVALLYLPNLAITGLALSMGVSVGASSGSPFFSDDSSLGLLNGDAPAKYFFALLIPIVATVLAGVREGMRARSAARWPSSWWRTPLVSLAAWLVLAYLIRISIGGSTFSLGASDQGGAVGLTVRTLLTVPLVWGLAALAAQVFLTSFFAGAFPRFALKLGGRATDPAWRGAIQAMTGSQGGPGAGAQGYAGQPHSGPGYPGQVYPGQTHPGQANPGQRYPGPGEAGPAYGPGAQPPYAAPGLAGSGHPGPGYPNQGQPDQGQPDQGNSAQANSGQGGGDTPWSSSDTQAYAPAQTSSPGSSTAGGASAAAYAQSPGQQAYGQQAPGQAAYGAPAFSQAPGQAQHGANPGWSGASAEGQAGFGGLQDHRKAGKIVAIVVGAVALVALLVWLVMTILGNTLNGPDRAATQVLEAINDGDVELLSDRVRDWPTDSPLLSADALRATHSGEDALTDISVDKVSDGDANIKNLTVSYSVAGERRTTPLLAEKEEGFSWKPRWKFSGLTGSIIVPTTGSVPYQVQGVDADLSGTVAAAPGAYHGTVDTTTGLSSSPTTVEVTPGAAEILRMTVDVSAEARQRVLAELDKYIAACAATNLPQPPNCPLEYYSTNSDGFRWKVNGKPSDTATVQYIEYAEEIRVTGSLDLTVTEKPTPFFGTTTPTKPVSRPWSDSYTLKADLSGGSVTLTEAF